jgi:SAM-dependent methyltransferase
MAGFDSPLATWNARFARDDYHFGEAPNAFLQRNVRQLLGCRTVLCVADGEGRNSVFLAEQGFAVTAFDFAPNAVAKAQRLAARRGVSVDHRLGDVYAWDWDAATYDAVVAIFVQFLPPEDRERSFAAMQRAVRPGGLFLIEGYRPEQVDYGTGGPPRREHMYTRDWLERQFAGWELLVLESYDGAIHEGRGHDLVARKPTARAT